MSVQPVQVRTAIGTREAIARPMGSRTSNRKESHDVDSINKSVPIRAKPNKSAATKVIPGKILPAGLFHLAPISEIDVGQS